MTADTRDKAAVEGRLWRELDHARFGMLGARTDLSSHFSPMTAYAEPESGKIWFYVNKDSDIAHTADGGVEAQFIVMSKDQDFQASIHGQLHMTIDLLHRDKYWSAAVSAWFPKGKDDVKLAMLCLDCAEADIWVSDAGVMKVGWEIAKANLTGAMPDLGGYAHLAFR